MTTDQIFKLKRYEGFTRIEPSQPFSEYFKDRDYDTVQLHDITPLEDEDIIGFAGAFRWKNNVLESLDGDTYYPDMKVIGYCKFEYANEKCLDILVEEW